MKLMIAGGTGFVGQALVKRLQHTGHEITIIGRNEKLIQTRFNKTVNALTWEQLKKDGNTLLSDFEAIINLSGANIAGKRWSPAYQEEIFSSRIESTYLLAELCAKLQTGGEAPALLNASAVGIYPAYNQLQSQPDTEEKAVREPHTYLQRVATAWESACEPAVAASCRVIKMRFAPVLDLQGGLLAKMLPVYRFGLGATLGNGKQPFPWISLHDLCRAIEWLITHKEISGAINLVAPERLDQKAFSHTLAKRLKRPHVMRVPASVLRLALGDLANELLLTGADVSCDRLQKSGFQFEHPTLQDFFK